MMLTLLSLGRRILIGTAALANLLGTLPSQRWVSGWESLIADVEQLVEEYVEQKEFVEEQKPYWLFVDTERGTELSYTLFNYFPAAHYKQAIGQALEQEANEQLRTDGGWYIETLYA